MRIVDADILCYALLDNHIASQYAKPLIVKGLRGELEIYITATTLLETYNTLFWHYKIRPRSSVARKVGLVAESLNLIPVSEAGFKIAIDENVPLGDAILVATAMENNIPIVVSNDKHIEKLCKKYGLVYENPIPEDIRSKLG